MKQHYITPAITVAAIATAHRLLAGSSTYSVKSYNDGGTQQVGDTED